MERPSGAATRACLVDNCSNKHSARGYCLKHYGSWKKKYYFRKCDRLGCTNVHCAFGLCFKHYEQLPQWKERYRLKRQKYSKTILGRLGSRRRSALKRASKLKRTPIWAELKQINNFYKRCPKGYHVDHIIPLQGKLISGLHVLSNLQYLTPSENSSKGNKWCPAKV